MLPLLTTRQLDTVLEVIVVFLGGGPVFWKLKKQGFVTTSTTEAEFTHLVPTAKSLQWIAHMLEELGYAQPPLKVLYTDSKMLETGF